MINHFNENLFRLPCGEKFALKSIFGADTKLVIFINYFSEVEVKYSR